jgi:hypothetical protein
MATKQVNIMDLKVGDIVHFHGARFEITSRREVQETSPEFVENGITSYVTCNGKWLSGNIERGYFGPTKDWNFQGNKRVSHAVEI